jgi:hypothetical protein
LILHTVPSRRYYDDGVPQVYYIMGIKTTPMPNPTKAFGILYAAQLNHLTSLPPQNFLPPYTVLFKSSGIVRFLSTSTFNLDTVLSKDVPKTFQNVGMANFTAQFRKTQMTESSDFFKASERTMKSEPGSDQIHGRK